MSTRDKYLYGNLLHRFSFTIAKKSYCIRGEIVPFAAHMDTELYEKSVYNSVYD